MTPYIDMKTSALAVAEQPAVSVTSSPPDPKTEANRIGDLLLGIPFFTLIFFCLRMFFALFFATIIWVIFWWVLIVAMGGVLGHGGVIRSFLMDFLGRLFAM